MKVSRVIAKILAALAAIAGVIYVIATYGDKIVAWAKSILPTTEDETEEVETAVEEAPAEEAAPAEEEAPAEEAAPAEETAEQASEEVPAEDETSVVADEADFEG